MEMRIRGIEHVNLTVSDLERSQSFYRDALGFETAFAKGSTVWLRAGGDLLGLSQGTPSPRQSFEHFGFMVDSPEEVDRWAEHLGALGVALERGPYDRSDGRSVYFSDPDGHLLEIFYVDPSFLGSACRPT